MSWERPREVDDSKEVLQEVVPEILERHAFLFCDPAEEGVELPGEGLRAEMEFSGPERGRLELIVPDCLGLEIAANLLGTEPEEETEEAAQDALAELLNVLCGQLLTALYGEKPVFDLSVPRVRKASGREWEEMAGRSGAVWFLVEENPVIVCLEEEEKSV